MSLPRPVLPALALTALTLALAAPASAAPAPCGDPLVFDDSGDQFFEPTGLGSLNAQFNKLGHPAGDNSDITGLFFTTDATTGTVDANIAVTDLNKTLPAQTDSQGGIYYYVVYVYDGATRFVKATNTDGATIKYAYGTIDDNGVYTTDGDTTGNFFEGPGGVVQIRVPDSVGGKSGETLGAAEATVDYIQGLDDNVGLNNHVDEAPDGASVTTPAGETYTAAPCPTA
jgi:hypothetical protein